MVQGFIKFPQDVRSKHILDIGGGASTATLELRKQGAIAYAIDYRYGDFPDLKKSVDNWLKEKGSPINVPSNEQLKKDLEKEIEQLNQQPPPGVNPALWSLSSKLTAERMRRMPIGLLRQQAQAQAESTKLYFREVRKTRDLFFGSYDRGERPYFAAVSGNLPFKDGSFDFVFSLLSVSFFLVPDRDVFMKSIQEMVRVVSKGGEFLY